MSEHDTYSAKRTPTTMESGKIGKGCLVGVVFGVLLAIVVTMSIGQHNGLVDKQENTRAKWQEVDSQYKRRYDLVPNLVATVQGAANFEQTTLTAVTEARASVGRAQVQLPSEVPSDPAQMQAYANAQQQLGSALQRLLLVAEDYPELKSSANFADLQSQLEGTENRITTARNDYIEAAKEYNAATRRFPSNFIAGMFGFDRAAELPVTVEERTVPQVKFETGGDAK